MSIPYDSLPADYKLFTHVDKEGNNLNVDIGRLLRDPKYTRLEVVALVITTQMVMDTLRNNAVNRDKVRSILRNPRHIPPITLLLDTNDNPPTYMLGDGHHRTVAFAAAQIETIPARIVPRALWAKYIVTGAPQITQRELTDLPPRR